MNQRHSRQRQLLTLLIAAKGRSVHVNRLAERIGLSPTGTKGFLMAHGDGLWLMGENAAWWHTTLRRIPDRLAGPDDSPQEKGRTG